MASWSRSGQSCLSTTGQSPVSRIKVCTSTTGCAHRRGGTRSVRHQGPEERSKLRQAASYLGSFLPPSRVGSMLGRLRRFAAQLRIAEFLAASLPAD
jgi:hypothetical protein